MRFLSSISRKRCHGFFVAHRGCYIAFFGKTVCARSCCALHKNATQTSHNVLLCMPQAVTHSDSPTPEDFASLCDEITSQRFGKLLPLDQLMRERDAGRVFFGFREGLIDFAPTFKVLKGEQGFSYDKKRSPGWCDRVLFKSVLPHKQASCSSYYTVPDICSSDHKPLAAVLSLPMATHTVAGAHRYHPAGRSSGTLSPQASNSPSNSSKTLSPARSLSPINSWSSSAAAKLARLSTRSLFPSRRSNTAGDNTLYKLYLASVCLGDQETWHALAALAGKSRSSSASRTDSSSGGREAARQDSGRKAQVERSSSGSGGAGAGSSKGKLRLQLVVSGACMAGIRYQQVSVRSDAMPDLAHRAMILVWCHHWVPALCNGPRACAVLV